MSARVLRRRLVVATLALVVPSGSALAGVPAPRGSGGCAEGDVGVPWVNRSSVALSGAGAPCQYRFQAAGLKDQLVIDITVRDLFDAPIPDIDVKAALIPGVSAAVCSCEPLEQVVTTDALGVTQAVFSRLGGRGTLDVTVTASAYCNGQMANITLGEETVSFTTPDQNASCETINPSTNIFDLAWWAGGLPPGYDVTSDFNCDGVVDVFDLGELAGGLNAGCGP
ncbi:MAG TPA: hypothetical protein VKU85_13865 [bacterium]|nr:hypothetical protein [bacterium]